MTSFSEQCGAIARGLPYTEYEAEEMSMRRARKVGEAIMHHCEEPRMDDLCAVLDVDTEGISARKITPRDVALAAWSNWGAGSFDKAQPKSTLDEDHFIILNDWFNLWFRVPVL